MSESIISRIIQSKKKNIKRSYSLKESTLKKLQHMKTNCFSSNINFSDIVDMAICDLYKKKNNK